MNYKIMAASVIVTGAILATSITLTTRDGSDASQVVERLSTVDIARASTSYAAPHAATNYEPAAPMAKTPGRAEPIPANTTQTGFVGPESFSIGIPQIAYRYGFGFRLRADSIKPMQDRHADQCEAKGSTICRIISMAQVDGEDGAGTGNLQLAVASPYARDFGKELTTSVADADGELIASTIDGEDLSKSLVDTEARLLARTVLRDRLLEVLRSRNGTVAELVEAERGVAQVNEEIDQARGWLSEMKGRVQFSQLHINYEAAPPIVQEGFAEAIFSAWSAIGSIFGSMLAALLIMVSVLGPIGMLIWLAILVWRRLGRRNPMRRLAEDEGELLNTG